LNMRYLSGVEIKVGDLVWYMNRTTTCRVSEIIDTPTKLSSWGLDKYGIFLCCDPSADVLENNIFVAQELFKFDDITPLD
jgi:hypothetical protein